MKNILLIKLFGSVPLWVATFIVTLIGSAIFVQQLAVFKNATPTGQGDSGFLQLDEKKQATEQAKSSDDDKNSANDSTDQSQDSTINSSQGSINSTIENLSQYGDQSSGSQPAQSGGQTSSSSGTANSGVGSGGGDSGASGSGETGGSDEIEDPPPDDSPPDDPPINSPPTAPTNATITYYDHDTVIVRANRATDSDGILRHELLRDGVVVVSSTSSANPIFITDSSPVIGQTYTYSMRAVDTLHLAGPGSNGVAVTIPPQDVTPPSLPANFRVVQNVPGSITFAWDASTDDQTSQGNIWYIITSPLNESDFYTWTTINPYQTYWFDEPGLTHDVYIQAIDEANNMTSKVGPVTFMAQ